MSQTNTHLYCLAIVDGPAAGSTFPFSTQWPLLIGRDDSCDVCLRDFFASRKHCKVWVENEMPLIRDLGSSNHTWVNGECVNQCALKIGDKISVGLTTLQIHAVADVPNSPASRAS